MLQQTRAQTVVPYFCRFVRKLPSFAALAAADEEKVLSLWEGLGYYAARGICCARSRAVRARVGRLPRTVKGLRALPGVGPYTAAAVASIAFGLSAPALDGNFERVARGS